MALVRGSKIFQTLIFDAFVYAVVAMRRTDLGLPHANMRLRTAQPMATSVCCAPKGSRPQAASDDGLVAADRGLDERTLAVAGRSLPFQPPVRVDRHDMPVALVGGLCIRAVDRVGARRNDDGSAGAVPGDDVIGRLTIISAIGRELTDRGVDLVK